MAWRVEFLPAADKASGKPDRQQRIQKFIQTRLLTATDPRRIGETWVA